MTKVTATNGELVELINGLFQVSELPGVDFGIVVAKNIKALQEVLSPLEKIGTPTPEFISLSQQINELANKKDDEGIKTLEESNQELISHRREQLEKLEAEMTETAEVELVHFSKDVLPESITGQQIINIQTLITQ